jgi:predicted DNA-binding protein
MKIDPHKKKVMLGLRVPREVFQALETIARRYGKRRSTYASEVLFRHVERIEQHDARRA